MRDDPVVSNPIGHAAPTGPLAGLRVLELAGIGPGPFAAMLLADMGADVLRVDRPGGAPPIIPPNLDVTLRSRRSVGVDLRDPRGVETVLRLVESADVLIEGFRPGVVERLGLSPEECWKRNPRLVFGRMTGWGQDGPLAPTAGHDITYLAISGALGAIGQAGGPPVVPLNLVGDYGGGALYLVIGVLAAVHETARSGRGQVVDAAIVDGAASLTAPFHGLLAGRQWRDERGVNLVDGGRPWYDVYPTSDGQWMAVGPMETKFYAEFLELLQLDRDAHDRNDPDSWPLLRQQFSAAFARRTRDEWTELFAGTDACVAPVLGLTEAADHPHLAARQTFLDVGGVRQPAPAPRFSRTPAAIQRPPALPGAHTREALRDWGLDDADELIANGSVIQN